MQSAFGVDHGEVSKGLFGGGKHAAQIGRHAAKGLPKIFGRQTGGARKAGAHAGKQYGGFRVAGGARKAGNRRAV